MKKISMIAVYSLPVLLAVHCLKASELEVITPKSAPINEQVSTSPNSYEMSADITSPVVPVQKTTPSITQSGTTQPVPEPGIPLGAPESGISFEAPEPEGILTETTIHGGESDVDKQQEKIKETFSTEKSKLSAEKN